MKLTKLFLVCLVLTSCSNNDNEALRKEINQLKKENINLLNQLKKTKYTNLVSSQLMLIPQIYTFKKDGDQLISGMFKQREEFPKFDLYYADQNFNFDKKDVIKYKSTGDNGFEFKYNGKEQEVRVVAVFNLDSVQVKLNGITGVP